MLVGSGWQLARSAVAASYCWNGYKEHLPGNGSTCCMTQQITFLPLRRDVEYYYSAADAYVGPSLQETFGLPPAEAMACGLPVITTRMAGVSEIIQHGVDGLVLENPTDAATLSAWLSRLKKDVDWRNRMGEAAVVAVAQFTWERNAALIRQLIERARGTRVERLKTKNRNAENS